MLHQNARFSRACEFGLGSKGFRENIVSYFRAVEDWRRCSGEINTPLRAAVNGNAATMLLVVISCSVQGDCGNVCTCMDAYMQNRKEKKKTASAVQGTYSNIITYSCKWTCFQRTLSVSSTRTLSCAEKMDKNRNFVEFSIILARQEVNFI